MRGWIIGIIIVILLGIGAYFLFTRVISADAPLAEGDLNGDGQTNEADLSQVISSWGKSQGLGAGKVDEKDLNRVLSNWDK